MWCCKALTTFLYHAFLQTLLIFGSCLPGAITSFCCCALFKHVPNPARSPTYTSWYQLFYDCMQVYLPCLTASSEFLAFCIKSCMVCMILASRECQFLNTSCNKFLARRVFPVYISTKCLLSLLIKSSGYSKDNTHS